MYSGNNLTQYNDYSGYLYPLQRLNWKVFGTLTFRDKSKRYGTERSTSLRNDDFYRLLSNSFYKLKINSDIVPYFLRHETALTSGWHVHFIIADCRAFREVSARTLCGELSGSWNRDFRGPRGVNGTCQIEPFDHDKDGLKYICKINKFERKTDDGSVEYFIPSPALKQLIEETYIGNPSVITTEDGQYSQIIQGSSTGNSEDIRQ
ncbi:MAG: hypothetical protein EBU90_21625 [Proteobacteria bacterium]|nr:hypothetical protein [Pseudomonadota bacterium]NBP15982.1 hypothetical protein [bacterium]